MSVYAMSRRRRALILMVSMAALSAGTRAAAGLEGTPNTGPPLFSLKIGGGFGFLPNKGGDLDLLRNHMEYEYTSRSPTVKANFDWDPLSWAYDIPLEFIIRLKPYLGLGLGTGIFASAVQASYTKDYQRTLTGSDWSSTYDDHYETSREFKIRLLPVCINLYLFYPLGPMTVYSYGGLGYYWGKLTHSSTIDYELKNEVRVLYSLPPIYTKREEYGKRTIEESLHKGSLGFQGGVGLEFALFRRLALGLEFFGRHLVFEGWHGSSAADSTVLIKRWDQDHGWYPDTTETDSLTREGTLWYSRIDDPLLDKETDAFYIEEAGTSDSALLGPKRGARIDLSSIGIRLTLRIHLGRSP